MIAKSPRLGEVGKNRSGDLGLKGTNYHVTIFEVTSSTVASADIKTANQRDLNTQEHKL